MDADPSSTLDSTKEAADSVPVQYILSILSYYVQYRRGWAHNCHADDAFNSSHLSVGELWNSSMIFAEFVL